MVKEQRAFTLTLCDISISVMEVKITCARSDSGRIKCEGKRDTILHKPEKHFVLIYYKESILKKI